MDLRSPVGLTTCVGSCACVLLTWSDALCVVHTCIRVYFLRTTVSLQNRTGDPAQGVKAVVCLLSSLSFCPVTYLLRTKPLRPVSRLE